MQKLVFSLQLTDKRCWFLSAATFSRRADIFVIHSTVSSDYNISALKKVLYRRDEEKKWQYYMICFEHKLEFIIWHQDGATSLQ